MPCTNPRPLMAATDIIFLCLGLAMAVPGLLWQPADVPGPIVAAADGPGLIVAAADGPGPLMAAVTGSVAGGPNLAGGDHLRQPRMVRGDQFWQP